MQAGFRSMLAFWLGGAAAPGGVTPVTTRRYRLRTAGGTFYLLTATAAA